MDIGKNIDEIKNITFKTIIDEIGKLPTEHEHCASLAAETLQEALTNYSIHQKYQNN